MSENLLSEITKLLIDLAKTIKVVSVYPENNPLPQKLRDSFNERFGDLIKDTTGLRFSIEQNCILYDNQKVFSDPDGDESLGMMFYKSGITRISFTPDFAFRESDRFLSVLKRFVNREEGAGDLVSLLWQAEIPGLEYDTIEDSLLNEYNGVVTVNDDGDDYSFIRSSSENHTDNKEVQYSSIYLDDLPDGVELVDADEADRTIQSGTAVEYDGRQIPLTAITGDKLADDKMGFISCPAQKDGSAVCIEQILNDAFALDDSDWTTVREILRQDLQRDYYATTNDLLEEMFHQDTSFPEFNDTVTTAEKTLTEFMRTGNLPAAVELLSSLKTLENFLQLKRTKWAERVHGALITAGGPERLKYLADTLNGNSEIPSSEILGYLHNFGWESLSSIVDLLGVLEYKDHRLAVCNYLGRAGREHVDIIAKGIYDKRWFVVRNTAIILARIGGNRAVSYFKKAIKHEESRVRLEIARGLIDSGLKDDLILAVELIWDNDEKVGAVALEGILKECTADSMDVLTTIINDDRFSMLTDVLQEKTIIRLSVIGGEWVVSYLSGMIHEWHIWPASGQDYYQRVAFNALANNHSEKAEKVLLKYGRSWRKKIRRQASEALKLRRSIIYGA